MAQIDGRNDTIFYVLISIMDKKIYFFKWRNLKIKAYDLVPLIAEIKEWEKPKTTKNKLKFTPKVFLRKYKSKIKNEANIQDNHNFHYKANKAVKRKQITAQKRVSSLKFYATIAFKFKLDKDTQ